MEYFGRFAAWTALGTILALTPAWAQDAEDTQPAEDNQSSDEGMTRDEAVQSGIELMTVTAQKQEESLLDVPIAVTSLGEEALELRQIDNFSDIQFNTPNLTFQKGQFTGTNIQIRGIGSALTAASADSGISTHVNNVFFQSPRLFETEFFDVERVEILRGPQGTLFGRNATGGVINVITARPDLQDYGFNVQAEYGNFNNIRVKGHANVPIIEDKLGIRVAGIYLERDGFTENIFTGNDIDGREQFSVRGSLRFTPTERTTIDIIGSYFQEDDNRVRSAKQLCNRDPSGVLGCLPDRLAFDVPNGNATLGGLLVTDLILGPLALTPFAGPGGGATAFNPPDLRVVNVDFEPIFEADETFIIASFTQELTDSLTLVIEGGYQETSFFSQQDFNNQFLADEFAVPDLLATAFPTVFETFFAGDRFPISAIDAGNTGLIGGNILSDQAFFNEGYDQSNIDAEQFSAEIRLQSDFEGPLNFLVAGYYLDSESESDYFVVANSLDYFSLVGAGVDGIGLVAPFFRSETDLFELQSFAFFGEAYYDVTDTFKITGGIRYTVDDKEIRDRQLLLNTAVPIGTTDANPALALVDADVTAPGIQEFRDAGVVFQEVTGRFVAQWTPELSFTDSTNIYFSYSRGFKSGGINPPFDAALFPNVPAFFDPEFINAYEVGTKNSLFGNRLQANLTGFFYDYSGLQISQIVNRTSVNVNVDARIFGLEAEFLAAPTDNWLFNLDIGYLNTSIQDTAIVDPRDPSNGSDDVTLIKDFADASNCVVDHNGGGDLISSGVADALGAAGVPFIPAQTPGIAFSGFSTCAGLQAALQALGVPQFVTDGVPQDLDGNNLQNSPELTFNIGAQYTYDFNLDGRSLALETRVDYYYQTSFFGRIFNDPIDEFDAFGHLNLQVTLYGPDQDWFVRGFVQNLTNNDAITGQFLTDASSGLYTNVFVLDPRLFGGEIGYRF